MFHRRELITAVSTLVLLAGCSGDMAEPAATATPEPAVAAAPVLPAALAAHGMEGLTSITYSGSAWRIRNNFRQTLSASPPWPEHDEITNYVRTIDLNATAARATGDTFASNVFFHPPVAGTYTQDVTPDQAAWGQQLEYWLTPWGFLKGADANGATEAAQTLDGAAVTAVTWMTPGTQVSPSGLQYTVTGYIGADNLVQRVETRVEDAFMGDMLVANVYSGYADMGGVIVPATIEQQRGGGGIFGVSVTAATANPANAAELLTVPPPATAGGPPPGGGAPAAAPAELAQELAPGVYAITGGYVALAVDFTDFVAVLEAGQSEARGQQILDEVKRIFPGKEIRYLINSHPHLDHTAGMVPFVREGVTIVTHANNVAFLNMALSTPRTLLGEATLTPKFEGAEGVHVIENAGRRLELHHIPTLHNDGTLVAFLPSERILFQADFSLPAPGAMVSPFAMALATYVDTNGLDFDQYLAVHLAAAPQTKADLLATIGK